MEFLHNDKEMFSQAINLVTNKNGIRPEIVEKDYYVTMILRLLSERLPFIVFKGGTSLSKCHKAINRFSEDIDITIDTTLSQSQKKKVKEAIKEVNSILGLSIPNIDETRSAEITTVMKSNIIRLMNWMMLQFCQQLFWKLLTLQFHSLYQSFRFTITSVI